MEKVEGKKALQKVKSVGQMAPALLKDHGQEYVSIKKISSQSVRDGIWK